MYEAGKKEHRINIPKINSNYYETIANAINAKYVTVSQTV